MVAMLFLSVCANYLVCFLVLGGFEAVLGV